ncbi:MAG: hypothetical protein V1735_05310 [Nanoarchaeota archaeon]
MNLAERIKRFRSRPFTDQLEAAVALSDVDDTLITNAHKAAARLALLKQHRIGLLGKAAFAAASWGQEQLPRPFRPSYDRSIRRRARMLKGVPTELYDTRVPELVYLLPTAIYAALATRYALRLEGAPDIIPILEITRSCEPTYDRIQQTRLPNNPNAELLNGMVTIGGRRLDLAPFLDGFPEVQEARRGAMEQDTHSIYGILEAYGIVLVGPVGNRLGRQNGTFDGTVEIGEHALDVQAYQAERGASFDGCRLVSQDWKLRLLTQGLGGRELVLLGDREEHHALGKSLESAGKQHLLLNIGDHHLLEHNIEELVRHYSLHPEQYQAAWAAVRSLSR